MKYSRWNGLVPETEEEIRKYNWSMRMLVKSVGRMFVGLALMVSMMMGLVAMSEHMPAEDLKEFEDELTYTVLGHDVTIWQMFNYSILAWILSPAAQGIWVFLRLHRKAERIDDEPTAREYIAALRERVGL